MSLETAEKVTIICFIITLACLPIIIWNLIAASHNLNLVDRIRNGDRNGVPWLWPWDVFRKPRR